MIYIKTNGIGEAMRCGCIDTVEAFTFDGRVIDVAKQAFLAHLPAVTLVDPKEWVRKCASYSSYGTAADIIQQAHESMVFDSDHLTFSSF